MYSPSTVTVAAPARAPRSLLTKLGVAGFTFFLVKGLLWLIVPGLIAAAL